MTGKFVTATYNIRQNYWYLVRGNETFYDEERRLRTWETKEEAEKWVLENHPELILEG